jgi:hypothetical protein
VKPSRLFVVALLAATMLLPAAAADAAIPGVNISGAPTASAISEALSTGAKRVRIFALWRDIEPDGAGQYPDRSPQTTLYDDAIRQLNAAGAQPIFVVTEAPAWANGAADPFVPPADPQTYAGFLRAFAAHNATVGPVAAYEVWNEPDESSYWHPGPSAAAYTALLKAAYAAARPVTPPETAILTGPFTGNNYGWLEALYANGAQGYFDGASVHTDTACLVDSPQRFYRENGRLARFTFLGYREVHNTLIAHGDNKPVWMTELGWSSTNGDSNSCARGASKGKKASGVSEADQAEYLKQAYACLANDPEVVPVAAWFTMRDEPAAPIDELRHYGLVRSDGAHKAAFGAFQAIAAANGGGPDQCGDFDPPKVDIISPVPGQQFVGKLDLEASATDTGVGLGRITFLYDRDAKIRNFTSKLTNGASVGLSPWQGSGKLGLGKHTIIATATDRNGNVGRATVDVEKVRTLKATMTPRFKLAKHVRCKGRTCTLTGVLSRGKKGRPSIGGKVSVRWERRNAKGKWRKLAGGLNPANKRFTFKTRLKYGGRWRVRVTYKSVAPYRSAHSKKVSFRVR